MKLYEFVSTLSTDNSGNRKIFIDIIDPDSGDLLGCFSFIRSENNDASLIDAIHDYKKHFVNIYSYEYVCAYCSGKQAQHFHIVVYADQEDLSNLNKSISDDHEVSSSVSSDSSLDIVIIKEIRSSLIELNDIYSTKLHDVEVSHTILRDFLDYDSDSMITREINKLNRKSKLVSDLLAKLAPEDDSLPF